MVLIGELVKALNLYSNPGVGNHSNVDKNSNARGASKKFWMQKTQSKWVFLTWFLCFIAILFEPLLFVFFFFLVSFFLGFALHSILAFHSRIIFLNKKKKGSKMCFALFSWIWNQDWPIYFYITCLCTLISLDELIYYTLLVEVL